MKHLNTLNTWSKVMGVGAIALISVAGCTGSDTDGDGNTGDSPAGRSMEQAGENMSNAAGQTGDAMANTAAEAGDAMANGAAAVGDAASNAAAATGDAVSGAASGAMNAAENVGDAAMTPKVKAALGANKTLNGSEINVDTMDNTVHLKGTVMNAAQKSAAEAIAKREAPGYKIDNQLTMK